MQPLKQKQRQRILIGILAAVLIITAIFWYLNYKKTPSVEGLIPSEKTVSPSATEEKLKAVKLDFSVFDNKLFKSLKSHGVLPVIKGETGRQNPFEPY